MQRYVNNLKMYHQNNNKINRRSKTMNKQTIITILLALVTMSADSQRLNKDVERIQYVYALV